MGPWGAGIPGRMQKRTQAHLPDHASEVGVGGAETCCFSLFLWAELHRFRHLMPAASSLSRCEVWKSLSMAGFTQMVRQAMEEERKGRFNRSLAEEERLLPAKEGRSAPPREEGPRQFKAQAMPSRALALTADAPSRREHQNAVRSLWQTIWRNSPSSSQAASPSGVQVASQPPAPRFLTNFCMYTEAHVYTWHSLHQSLGPFGICLSCELWQGSFHQMRCVRNAHQSRHQHS